MNASTPASRVPGEWSINGRQSAGASTGAHASAKSSAPSLCRIRNRPPVSSCSTWYSTCWRRGATTRGSAAGSSAGTTRTSEVTELCESICTNRSERVRSTLTQNRSSGSS